MREKLSSTGIGHTAISSSQRKLKSGLERNRIAFGLTILVAAAVLAACSPATSTVSPTLPGLSTSTAAAASATSAPAVPAAASATSAPAQAGGPASTSLDPCQLITSQEASQLAGASFGAGVESTEVGGLKMCTYGAQTTNVFLVEVIQAADAATAQAQ